MSFWSLCVKVDCKEVEDRCYEEHFQRYISIFEDYAILLYSQYFFRKCALYFCLLQTVWSTSPQPKTDHPLPWNTTASVLCCPSWGRSCHYLSTKQHLPVDFLWQREKLVEQLLITFSVLYFLKWTINKLNVCYNFCCSKSAHLSSKIVRPSWKGNF